MLIFTLFTRALINRFSTLPHFLSAGSLAFTFVSLLGQLFSACYVLTLSTLAADWFAASTAAYCFFNCCLCCCCCCWCGFCCCCCCCVFGLVGVLDPLL